MKIFTKQIKTCDDCPNLSDGAMSNCTYDKKNPKMICSFLDKIPWLKDKNIKYPLSIPDWCPLNEITTK